MPHISYTAKFAPDDTLDRIVEDLACPACGHRDPLDAHNCATDNQMRIFCEGCGAFVTVRMSADQAKAILRWSSTVPTVTEDPPLSSRRAPSW